MGAGLRGGSYWWRLIVQAAGALVGAVARLNFTGANAVTLSSDGTTVTVDVSAGAGNTAAPIRVNTSTTVAAAGSASTLARSDHDHPHALQASTFAGLGTPTGNNGQGVATDRLGGTLVRGSGGVYVPCAAPVLLNATLTDGATITPNLDTDGTCWVVTLGGNRALALPTGTAFAGMRGYLIVIQDGVGARTLNVRTAGWRAPGGVNPVLSNPAGSVDVLLWRYDGTRYTIEAQGLAYS